MTNVGATVTVTPYDAAGNAIPYYAGSIRFTSTDPRAVLPADYTFLPFSDGGSKPFPVTFNSVGLEGLSVIALNGTAATTNVRVNPPVASFVETVTGITGGLAVTNVGATVTVTPYDAAGNAIPYYAGSIRFTSTDPRAVLPADYTFLPFSDGGSKPFPVTFNTVGLEGLTVIAGNGTTATTNVRVNPPVASFVETVTGITGGLAVTNVGASVTVTPYDASGNTIPYYAGSIRFTSTDPRAVLPADYTFLPFSDGGSKPFPVMFNTVGLEGLTVIAGNGTTATVNVRVNPPVAKFVESVIGAVNGVAITNIGAIVTVTPYDAAGNSIPYYAGSIRFTSTDPNAVLPAAYTFLPFSDGGSKAFPVTFNTVGFEGLTVIAGNGTTATTTVRVNYPVARFTETVTGILGGVAVAGASAIATVEAFDAAGNPIPYYAGTVHFTSTDPKAVLPATYVFSPFVDGGIKAFPVTFNTAGMQKLSVVAANGTTATAVTLVNPPVAKIAVSFSGGYGGMAVVGIPLYVNVAALDASGNLIPHYGGTIHFVGTDSKTVLPASYTFNPYTDTGIKSFPVTFETAGPQGLFAVAANGAQGPGTILVVNQYITDGNFNSPVFQPKTYQYRPSNTPWIFNTGSGISTGNSDFTRGSAVAANSQVAFIQGGAALGQWLYLSPGKYSISFLATQRTNIQTNYQKIGVYFDGAFLEDVAPPVGTFGTYTTASFTVTTAGVQGILFKGENPLGGDDTAFITTISVGQSLAVKPASSFGDILVTTDGRIFDTNFINVQSKQNIIHKESSSVNVDTNGFLGKIVQADNLLPNSFGLTIGANAGAGTFGSNGKGIAGSDAYGVVLFNALGKSEIGAFNSKGIFASSPEGQLFSPAGEAIGGDFVKGLASASGGISYLVTNATAPSQITGNFETTLFSFGYKQFQVSATVSTGFDSDGDFIYVTTVGLPIVSQSVGFTYDRYLTYTSLLDPFGKADLGSDLLAPDPYDPDPFSDEPDPVYQFPGSPGPDEDD